MQLVFLIYIWYFNRSTYLHTYSYYSILKPILQAIIIKTYNFQIYKKSYKIEFLFLVYKKSPAGFPAGAIFRTDLNYFNSAKYLIVRTIWLV